MASRTSGAAAQSGRTPGVSVADSPTVAPCPSGVKIRATAALFALAAAALAGCASTPAPTVQSARTTANAPSVEAPDDARIVSATGADAGIANPLPASPAASLAGTAAPFATKNALYTPVPFASVPGWATDNVVESWEAFRRGCAVLGGKSGWAAPCAASRGIDTNDSASVRRFFEDNFTVYQIRNVDKSTRGVLTGYYEPILKGSRERRAPYVYPVYGVPNDMLFLDSRRLPPNARGTPVPARVEGRNVIPLATVPMSGKTYTLRLGDSTPDIRDKKLRLRRNGSEIVPYFARAEIERGRLNAPVLAYVEDPAMLYSMQLQGAGKIRLPDGSILRLAYAEQNGLAFNPPVASAGSKGRKILVRGVEIDLEEGTVSTQSTQDTASGPAPDDAPQSSLLRGAQDIGEPDAASAIASGNADSPPDSSLLRGFNLAKGAGPAVHPARVSNPSPAPAASTAARPSALASAPPIAYTFASSDPSYVFFRAIPDSPTGPIGALGVPLSAGRSAAIDPRTTPLGAPVFINANEGASGASSVTRLLMAQDAGGAIRGAVRADYFFGTGPQAQQQASRMKQPTQMWVLLPKGLRISAKETAVRVRGGPSLPSADCVVSDPDLCVDDTP
ncbi:MULTISPECIES: murein transglycosylase A [unclassified Caballeronia]|uniref:murein transglycosylase A n=1 Tax=unclassified Caballeronia TaxID=2646786 RepID=UPI002860D5B0|nr:MULTISPECIES: murein transglycosylase A [unclassified Caballeronia]MDR5753777.1 murein transglycosylase A [Caballeronia sp. LZ024]MDR5840156.1 murein transglycosylase A [Caballeronia sp. LZ031]